MGSLYVCNAREKFVSDPPRCTLDNAARRARAQLRLAVLGGRIA